MPELPDLVELLELLEPELPRELLELPRELPTFPLEADRPEEELELRGELLMPECGLEGSPTPRVAELPMPSSFRLPRSLRPLVLLESDDPPRLFAAAE